MTTPRAIRTVEVTTPAGRLRCTTPGQHVYDGHEAIAVERTGPDEWTLNGKPVTEDRARQILARLQMLTSPESPP